MTKQTNKQRRPCASFTAQHHKSKVGGSSENEPKRKQTVSKAERRRHLFACQRAASSMTWIHTAGQAPLKTLFKPFVLSLQPDGLQDELHQNTPLLYHSLKIQHCFCTLKCENKKNLPASCPPAPHPDTRGVQTLRLLRHYRGGGADGGSVLVIGCFSTWGKYKT